MPGSIIRVVLIVPIVAIRAGLHTLLSSGGDEFPSIEVIDEAANLADLGAIPPETDVLLLSAEAASSGELSRLLAPLAEPVALLVLADWHPQVPTSDLFQAGNLNRFPLRAWGILSVDSSAEELVAAVRALNEGLLVGTPPLMEALLVDGSAIQAPAADKLIEPLTERESEVLQLLAQGLPNKQIAGSLGISEHTVKFHVSSLYGKLGATNRTEAVRIGVQSGLILL